MAELRRCMTPECDGPMMWKGLCNRCYGQAKYHIERGETTWKQLAELGLCVTNSYPFNQAFYAAFKKATYNPKMHKQELKPKKKKK